jgi:hypothetical protein
VGAVVRGDPRRDAKFVECFTLPFDNPRKRPFSTQDMLSAILLVCINSRLSGSTFIYDSLQRCKKHRYGPQWWYELRH